jgi:tetratricopeptide (TPR) repeat protein
MAIFVTLPYCAIHGLDAVAENQAFARGLSSLIAQTFDEPLDNVFVFQIDAQHVDPDKTLDPVNLGRELGVDYLLAGETMWIGTNFKAMVRLIDTSDGRVIWNDRFDGDQGNLSDLLDLIAANVANLTGRRIAQHSLQTSSGRATEDLEFHKLFWKARAATAKLDEQSLQEALHLATILRQRSPENVHAMSLMATIKLSAILAGVTDNPERVIADARALSELAVSLEPDSFPTHWIAALVGYAEHRLDQAVVHFDRLIAMAPGTESAYRMRAMAHFGLKDYEAAGADARMAMRLAPEAPNSFMEWQILADVELKLGNLDLALKAAQTSIARNPNYVSAYLSLAMIYGETGELEAAKKNLDLANRIAPKLVQMVLTDPLGRHDLVALEALGLA